MMIKMNAKIFMLLAITAAVLVFSESVSAVVVEPNRFNYSEILEIGKNRTTIPVTGVSAIGFVCSSAKCASVNASLDLSSGNVLTDFSNPPVMNSGSDANMTIFYPTNLNSSFGYGLYFFKDGYIPFEGDSTLAESGVAPEFTNFLAKKKTCSAPIENFTVINNAMPNVPLVIDVSANLSADTAAALRSAGPLDFVPPQLQRHYSVNTSVTLNITNSTGDVVRTETQYFLIDYSGRARANFTWTPTVSDNYTASVKTGVPDEKCLSDVPDTDSKDFRVWSEVPQNACYTILNSLSSSPIIGTRGQPITFRYNKTSNFAEPNANLIPVQTNATYKIRDSANAEVFSSNVILPANPGSFNPEMQSFSWTPAAAGKFSATIAGFAEDARCINKTNPIETITGAFDVAEPPPVPTPAPAPVVTSGGGGGGGGGGVSSLQRVTLANMTMRFIGLNIPDSLTFGETLVASGCVESLDREGSVEMRINNILKNAGKVTPSSNCFYISGGVPELGSHSLALSLKNTSLNFSKQVRVVAAQPKETSEIKILDISAGEIIAGVPSEINVTLESQEPQNATISLYSDGELIGRKNASVSGRVVVQFAHTFSESGAKNLMATATAGEHSATAVSRQVEVKKAPAGPAGLFLGAGGATWAGVIALIAALAIAGYYSFRKGYFSGLAPYFAKLKERLAPFALKLKGKFSGMSAYLKEKISGAGPDAGKNEALKSDISRIKESVAKPSPQEPQTFENQFYGRSRRLGDENEF